MRAFVSILTFATVVAVVKLGYASTPFGGDDSGFVPPSQAALRCENATLRHSVQLDAAFTACHKRLATQLFKGKPFDDEACEDKAANRFTASQSRLRGCPACIAGVDAQGARAFYDGAHAADTYCSGDASLGGDDGGHVPSDKATLRCENRFAGLVLAAVRRLASCHVRLATKSFKKKSFDDDACEDKVIAKFNAARSKLSACPCVMQSVIVNGRRSLFDHFNSAFYCASGAASKAVLFKGATQIGNVSRSSSASRAS